MAQAIVAAPVLVIEARIALPVAAVIGLEIEACRRAALVPEATHLEAEEADRAEARRAPAVREAVPVCAVVAAAEGGGDPEMFGEKISGSLNRNVVGCCAGGLFLACALTVLARPSQAPQQQPPAKATTPQKTFATPTEAAEAFIQAAASNNTSELINILGADGEDLVSSEDPVQDKNIAAEFSKKADEKHSVVVDPKNPNRATLEVGNDEWPLPIPLMRQSGKWRFDTKAGRQEMLFRRIGANELDAIEICRGYVDAQQEYASEKHDNSEVNQYAQKIISTPGKRDGLAWRNADGSLGGPIAEGIADALQEGYTDRTKPYHGYFFKILKGQGPHAPLGQMDFVVEGAMIGGFALAAAPADYRVTGVKTFIVGYDGIVYQKDLGPDTLKIFQSMDRYDPDSTWKRTDDGWPWDAAEDSASLAEQK